GAVEILFPFLCIARNHVLDCVETSVGYRFYPRVQKLSDVVNLGLGERKETGHALVWTSVEDDWADQLALLIVKHQRRTDQVGTLRSRCLNAVTESTIRTEQLLSARCRDQIRSGTQSEEK